MKKIIVFLGLIFLSNILVSAKPIINPDFVLLRDGTILKGKVESIRSNSYKFNTGNKVIKLKNDEVVSIAFNKDLSNSDKFKLGVLDGKKYAKNKGANFAVGFFFSYIGTALVYATSSQEVTEKAKVAELGQGVHNKILDDFYYTQGFEKGAKKNAGGNALIGALSWTTVVLFSVLF